MPSPAVPGPAIRGATMLDPMMPQPTMPHQMMHYPTMPHPMMPPHLMMPHPIMRGPTMPGPMMPGPATHGPAMPYPMTPHPMMPYPAMHGLARPFPMMPHPAMPHFGMGAPEKPRLPIYGPAGSASAMHGPAMPGAHFAGAANGPIHTGHPAEIHRLYMTIARLERENWDLKGFNARLETKITELEWQNAIMCGIQQFVHMAVQKIKKSLADATTLCDSEKFWDDPILDPDFWWKEGTGERGERRLCTLTKESRAAYRFMGFILDEEVSGDGVAARAVQVLRENVEKTDNHAEITQRRPWSNQNTAQNGGSKYANLARAVDTVAQALYAKWDEKVTAYRDRGEDMEKLQAEHGDWVRERHVDWAARNA